MKGEMVSLAPQDLVKYRSIIETFRRRQLNEKDQVDGRKLWVDLETFLRSKYEGRAAHSSYESSSIMGDAFARLAKSLLRKKRRPLVFADTNAEAEFLLRSLRSHDLDARTWANIASEKIAGISSSAHNNMVIVAVKTTEGQGINIQKHADTIICRPTPGDHLEQMKGRVDRPGQSAKELHLYVVVCEHTIEEAKFANIRLAGNFFREYIAPVATRYKEKIDLTATLAAGGTGKLKRGTVSGTWKRELEAAGQSGCFASVEAHSLAKEGLGESISDKPDEDSTPQMKIKEENEPKYKPRNTVIRNKGDKVAVREAKASARRGGVSPAVFSWLFAAAGKTKAHMQTKNLSSKQLPMYSLERFSDRKPALVLDHDTVKKAVMHLTQNDPKLGALIARVGPDCLMRDCGEVKPPTQARLFDRCIRAITFTMVSVDAGNAFLRRLAIKVGVCLESMHITKRHKILQQFLADLNESQEAGDLDSPDHLLQALLRGAHNQIMFTPSIVDELVQQCEILKGERSGYPVSSLLQVFFFDQS